MTKTEIHQLFDKWNAALRTGDPKKVASLYDNEGVLLPTISNKVRRTQEEREDYFNDFLSRKPQGVIDESTIRLFGDIAIHSGIYTFTFGDNSKVQARFSFVYRASGQDWLIIEHHSSAMPEG